MRIETRMKLMDHLRPEFREVCPQEPVVGENGSELLVEDRGVVATELLINLEFRNKNVRDLKKLRKNCSRHLHIFPLSPHKTELHDHHTMTH
jgi:hypothetical protein